MVSRASSASRAVFNTSGAHPFLQLSPEPFVQTATFSSASPFDAGVVGLAQSRRRPVQIHQQDGGLHVIKPLQLCDG